MTEKEAQMICTDNIERYLVLSTCHVTEEDGKILDDIEVAFDDGFGWRLPLTDNIEELRATGLSPSFWKCVEAAKQQGCQWVHLDRDGDVLLKELNLDFHDW